MVDLNTSFFQSDILSTMWYKVSAFFSFSPIFWHIGLFLILFSVGFVLIYRIKPSSDFSYDGIFPSDRFSATVRDVPAFCFLALCLAFFTVVLYCTENSFFRNYDAMYFWAGTTETFFKPALVPLVRYNPLNHFEWNIWLSITQNCFLIKAILIGYLGLILYLMYRLFDFFPVTKRLLMLSTFVIVPTVLHTLNSVIYGERNILILILIAMLAMKKYALTKKLRYAYVAVICATLSLYFKETVCLFWAGILLASFIYHLKNKNIMWGHLWKTVRRFPFEFPLGVSLFVFLIALGYATFFNKEWSYAVKQIGLSGALPLINVFWIYSYELVIMFVATAFYIFYGLKRQTESNPLFREGLFLGAFFVTLGVLYLKLLPTIENYRTYYLFLSAIFGIIYITFYAPRKALYSIFCLIILCGAIIDIHRMKMENGRYYGDVARFFQTVEDESITIYLASGTEKNLWFYAAWPLAYKHHFKDKDMTFKFLNFKEDIRTIDYIPRNYGYLNEIEEGDYYIVSKKHLEQGFRLLNNQKKKQVYENDLFIIFYILGDE